MFTCKMCLVKWILIVRLILIPVYADVFLNKWAVHIDGDKQEAKRIAEKHGFKSHGQVRSNRGLVSLD